jgi:hypothetical protein
MNDVRQNGGTQHRDDRGRFLTGNPGGPGRQRPGSGRKPKPADHSLLEKLYDNLDWAAPIAMKVLDDVLESGDERLRVKAAELVLRKVLPDQSMRDLRRDEMEPERPPSLMRREALQAAAKAYAEAQHK